MKRTRHNYDKPKSWRKLKHEKENLAETTRKIRAAFDRICGKEIYVERLPKKRK